MTPANGNGLEANAAIFQSHSLSDAFLDALKLDDGLLRPLLNRVHSDHTLMMALRGHYINIYYRGGSLMKVLATSAACDRFEISFDSNYGKEDLAAKPDKTIVTDPAGLSFWLGRVPALKNLMDNFFVTREKLEREFQQVVSRENNHSAIANETDYWIADIEYAHGNARFDMLAIRWLTTDHRHTNKFGLALVEMKFGDNALEGPAGFKAHLEALHNTLSSPHAREKLASVAVDLFNQLTDLGLITVKQRRKLEVTTEKPEIIFLLANHHPGKTALGNILNEIDASKFSKDENFTLKFFVASFAGYAMYKACMYDLDEFRSLVNQLYTRWER